jgi:hypothetical protein
MADSGLQEDPGEASSRCTTPAEVDAGEPEGSLHGSMEHVEDAHAGYSGSSDSESDDMEVEQLDEGPDLDSDCADREVNKPDVDVFASELVIRIPVGTHDVYEAAPGRDCARFQVAD